MDLLYRSPGWGDQRRQGAHALAVYTAVFYTDSSLCESFLTEVCPTAASLDIHELQSVDTPPAVAATSVSSVGVRHLRALGAVSSSPIRPLEWAALTGQEASSETLFAQASRCFQLRDDLLGSINSSRRQTRRNDGDERRKQIVARRGLEAIYLHSSVRCCVREMDSLVAGKSKLYAGTRLVSSL